MRRPAARLYEDKKEGREERKRVVRDLSRGQFAKNFKNATPRSARNEISQWILIQERPRAIADVNARYRLSDLPSERAREKRFFATESRSRDIILIFFDIWYAFTVAEILISYLIIKYLFFTLSVIFFKRIASTSNILSLYIYYNNINLLSKYPLIYYNFHWLIIS